jgi:hypothetical protein
MPQITISTGFTPDETDLAFTLYWQAFGAKLGKVLGPEHKARPFITAVMDPSFALVARSPDGKMLGMAGFKTSKGALVGGELPDMHQHYGFWGGLWRGLLLALLERNAVYLRCVWM